MNQIKKIDIKLKVNVRYIISKKEDNRKETREQDEPSR